MTPSERPFAVLCVEDDPITTVLFEQALSTVNGIVLRCAATLAQARSLTQAWRPDLMVLDAHLPDGRGEDLLIELRSRAGYEHIPAILCSADDDPALQARGRALGFEACWAKPVDAQRWRDLVASLRARGRI